MTRQDSTTSRRQFCRRTAGVLAGGALLGAASGSASAAEQISFTGAESNTTFTALIGDGAAGGPLDTGETTAVDRPEGRLHYLQVDGGYVNVEINTNTHVSGEIRFRGDGDYVMTVEGTIEPGADVEDGITGPDSIERAGDATTVRGSAGDFGQLGVDTYTVDGQLSILQAGSYLDIEITHRGNEVELIDGRMPQDLDADGQYMDLTGNGEIDNQDAVVFFEHMNDPVMTDHVEAYDYTGNGEVDYQDLIHLYNQI